MFSSYVRSAIHKAQVMEVVLRLTPLQIEAMDHLDALASRRKSLRDRSIKI